jgi:FhuF 2Fe-2S C-terminal domain
VRHRARSACSPSPAEALRAGLAALGPFFAIETHSSRTRAQSPWQPFGALFSSAEALATRIDGVRSALAAAAECRSGTIEFRVAASVAQLGLCARLIAPALGSAVLGKPLPIDIMSAWWIPGLGGPFRLSLPETAFSARTLRDGPTGAGEACAPLLRLLYGPIRSLVELTASMGVSRRLLWGNVGSAINGAAVMITAARSGLARETAGVSSEVLRFPELAGSYRGQPVTSFRRQSCCLIYRIAKSAPPEYCGDCILSERRQRRPLPSIARPGANDAMAVGWTIGSGRYRPVHAGI